MQVCTLVFTIIVDFDQRNGFLLGFSITLYLKGSTPFIRTSKSPQRKLRAFFVCYIIYSDNAIMADSTNSFLCKVNVVMLVSSSS